MNDVLAYGIGILGAFVLGSIPTGLWLGRWLRGIDIREHGSKNIGATNTLRVLGKGLGAAALLGDMLKGLLPVLAAQAYAAQASGAAPALPVVCGIAAILGHTFSIFLRFRGGKGVATSTGVFLGLAPIATGIAFLVFAATVALTRMVSAGSLAAALALSLAVALLPTTWPVRIVVWIAAALVFIRHRSNIQRILNGTESRIGQGATEEH